MSTKRLTWIALIALALFASGCATGGGGAPAAPAAPAPPPPEEVIGQMIGQAMDLLAAGEIENLMALYADDFSSDQGMDKAGMTGFLSGARDQGFLEGFTANTEAMAVTVDGDTATVTGVTVEGAFGVLNLGFGLANRAGSWVIVSQTQQ